MTLPSLVGCWFEADLDELELTELDIIFSFTEYISFYEIFSGVLERQPVLQKIGDRRQELSRQHFTSNVNSILFIIHFSNSIKILVYKISFTRKTIFSVCEIRNIFHNCLDFFPICCWQGDFCMNKQYSWGQLSSQSTFIMIVNNIGKP